MYTTSIYKYMNKPLRDQERKKKNIACPLPVTTWFAAEGIKLHRLLHAPAEHILRVESIGAEPDLHHAGATEAAEVAPSSSGAASLRDGANGGAEKILLRENTGDDNLRGVSVDNLASGADARVPEDSTGMVSEPVQTPQIALVPGPVTAPAETLERQDTTKMDLSEGLTLWRGLRNTKVTDNFTKSGGTEQALMSTTTDISVAVRYSLSSNSLLFKIKAKGFMTMGADLKWLSAFPGEAEFLYPPLTYLKPTGRTKNISVGKNGQVFKFTVVEVIPYMA